MDVEYQPGSALISAQIRKAIESAGLSAWPSRKLGVYEHEVLDPAEAANEEEYRTLMRKFWFAAVVSVPVMALSYPDLIPGLRDWMPMGSETRRIVWALLGVAQPSGHAVVGLAILHRHVGRAQAPRRQHAHADRHRHHARPSSIRSSRSPGLVSSRTWRSPRSSGMSPMWSSRWSCSALPSKSRPRGAPRKRSRS